MVTEGNKLEELALRILDVAHAKLTGTLSVASTEDQVKHFVFVEGHIADIDTGREDTVLEAALLNTGGYSEKDLKRARRGATKKNVSLATALLDSELVSEEMIVESAQLQLEEEACGVFDWDVQEFDFVEHGEEERLEVFYSDLTAHIEIYIDGEEIFLEAVNRIERWDLVVSHVAMLYDVFYATPNSFKYFHEPDQYPVERAIIGAVDGIKDVEEVIEASGQDPFTGLKVVRHLMVSNELELVNPVQMYQLGVEASAGENLEKACKLFRRAHERGLDDFDLQLKLAQSYEGLGKKKDATNWYILFGEKCHAQLRFDEAIRSLKKAIRLDPDNMAVRENFLTLLFQNNRREEAVEELIELAARKASHGDKAGALSMLIEHQGDEEKDLRLQQSIIELAESTGNSALATRERETLAQSLEARKDVEAALEVYQKMYCDGDNSVDVRLKLVDLHRRRGNRQKALDHAQAVLSLPEMRRAKDREILEQVHRTVHELKPADIRSNQWLVDQCLHAGDEKQAADLLVAWIGHLQREGEAEDVEHAYQQLIAIDDQPEHRWGLVSTMEKLGRDAEAQRELRSLANLALRRKDFDQSMRALDYILKQSPFDLETRKMQVELYEATGDRELATQKCREVALLDIIAGNVQEAEQFCRQLLVNHPTDAEMVTKLGQLCQESGDHRKATEQFLKAAKIHLESRNYGLCESTVAKLLALEPGHQEGKTLLEELKAVSEGTAPVSSPATTSTSSSGSVTRSPRNFFQPPAAVLTNVSKSMARLKNLKSQGMKDSVPIRKVAKSGASGSQGVSIAKSKISDITSKLRSLKGGSSKPERKPESAASTAGAVSEPPSGGAPAEPAAAARAEKVQWKSEVELPTASAALQAAASRLKALASKGGSAATPAAAQDTGDSSADAAPAEASGKATKKLQLGSAASRLAALRGQSPQDDPQEEKTQEEETQSLEAVT